MKKIIFLLQLICLFAIGHSNTASNLEKIYTNDELFAGQWGLHNTGQVNEWRVPGLAGVDINLTKAWELSKGSQEIIVAVIDTGIDYNHPDLKDNIWTNEAELNGKPHVDDDGNGYVDDIHGYDVFNNDGDPMDDNGHGTHIAGIIGATGNNSMGISGVNWKVKLMPIKASNHKMQSQAVYSIKAIEYAIKMGARIINASWGRTEYPDVRVEAIKKAGDNNILFIAAAGNNSRDNDSKKTIPTYPASLDLANIISVASFNQKGELSHFSAYGATSVDLAAPGDNILSTWPNNSYKLNSGTSTSTAFVTGVAALLLSTEPQLTALQVKERILNGAAPLTKLKGKVLTGGRLDAYYTLKNDKAPPDKNDPDSWKSQSVNISSNHPYKESEKQFWEINIQGAQAISVYFDKFLVENEFDFVDLHDRSGKLISRLYGNKIHGWSRIVVGDYVKISITSDQAGQNYGFDITKVAYK